MFKVIREGLRKFFKPTNQERFDRQKSRCLKGKHDKSPMRMDLWRKYNCSFSIVCACCGHLGKEIYNGWDGGVNTTWSNKTLSEYELGLYQNWVYFGKHPKTKDFIYSW